MAGVQESGRKVGRLAFPLAAVPSDLGERIAGERRRRRWSQGRLASRAGVARASVCRIEAGGTPSRADTLFRIAQALQIDMRVLVPAWPEWDFICAVGHGPRTRERRRLLDLSLAELAAAAGVSEATLSRHERGVGLSPALLKAVGDKHYACNQGLAEALGFVDLSEFDSYCNGMIAGPRARDGRDAGVPPARRTNEI